MKNLKKKWKWKIIVSGTKTLLHGRKTTSAEANGFMAVFPSVGLIFFGSIPLSSVHKVTLCPQHTQSKTQMPHHG